MSSHGSHEISSDKAETVEKHLASAAVPTAAVPTSQGATAGKKEKTVHNVGLAPLLHVCGWVLTMLDLQAELYAAIKEANINPWSKESFHLYCEQSLLLSELRRLLTTSGAPTQSPFLSPFAGTCYNPPPGSGHHGQRLAALANSGDPGKVGGMTWLTEPRGIAPAPMVTMDPS